MEHAGPRSYGQMGLTAGKPNETKTLRTTSKKKKTSAGGGRVQTSIFHLGTFRLKYPRLGRGEAFLSALSPCNQPIHNFHHLYILPERNTVVLVFLDTLACSSPRADCPRPLPFSPHHPASQGHTKTPTAAQNWGQTDASPASTRCQPASKTNSPPPPTNFRRFVLPPTCLPHSSKTTLPAQKKVSCRTMQYRQRLPCPPAYGPTVCSPR